MYQEVYNTRKKFYDSNNFVVFFSMSKICDIVFITRI